MQYEDSEEAETSLQNMVRLTTRDVRYRVGEGLHAKDQPMGALRAADWAMRYVSEAADQFPQRARWDCKKGCSFCCHVVVSVTPLEVFRLGSRFDALVPERGPAVDRLRARLARSQPFTYEQLLDQGMACGLLGADGACSVYAERPSACRALASFNVKGCEASIGRPGDQPEGQVSIDLPLHSLGQAVSIGLRLACSDRGLETTRYELNEALLRALDTPDAAQRWLGGEQVFQGCMVADDPEDARVLGAAGRATADAVFGSNPPPP
jgi:Fe-S-cluster containining protein